MPKKIAIIGAGIAGLTLARELSPLYNVEIFEKSRGVGGRLSTRYGDPFEFDHGAQYFTAYTPEFKEFLTPLLEQLIITQWNARFVEMDRDKILAKKQWDKNYSHYVGFPKMNSIGKFLANNLSIQSTTRVTKIVANQHQWTLLDENSKSLGQYDWVITAIPAEQATEILPNDFCHLQKISRISMQGCFSLMLGFNKSIPISWQAASVKNADINWIAINNSKPGRSHDYSMLAHTNNQWADTHMEDNSNDIKNHLLNELSDIIHYDARQADHIDLHRWRYANITKQSGENALIDSDNQLAACGDWCIEGRVESAFLSGKFVAEILKGLTQK